ncbi:hypothetical protein [Ewingella americana]|uniref:Uncharacterized protein n=1 Tax=Ewingella americana TaxID=41202 RepID=A0A502GED4_9GAMM|nr:hypothetical protein [Ewingella americana]TPG59898.1 hypothetical protein EAH77_15135 [Ewingella americana]
MATIEDLKDLESLLSKFTGDAHMLRYINQNLIMPKLKAAYSDRFDSFAKNYSVCDIAFVKFDSAWYPCLVDGFSLADENGVVREFTKAELPTSDVWAYYYYDSADKYESYKVDLLTMGKVMHIRALDGESKEDVLIRLKDEMRTIVDNYPNHKLPHNFDAFFEILSDYIS